jgi:hypothetical protein
VGGSRGRWEGAAWKDDIFTPQIDREGGSKKPRRFEEGDRGGHGPKTGRSAKQEQVGPNVKSNGQQIFLFFRM